VIGLGCMRLDDEAVIRAALDAGVRLFDTAGVYGDGRGGNERLLARALGADRDRVEVVTKVGLVRPPDGRWFPDGRTKALEAACAASVAALGPADLLLLHAPDPRVPLARSVRALAGLARDGAARAIGVCNVSRTQLDEALAVADLAAVQVRLSWLDDGPLRDGVVARCRERGIRVLAHTPLGGVGGPARLLRDPVLAAIAARHGVTAAQVALAWLLDLGVVPLAGATRVETARAAAAAARLALDDDDRRARAPARAPAGGAEVVILMGYPGAGKSTLAAAYVDGGWQRLNRDVSGGRLAAIAAALERGLAAGGRRFVLDNTYASRRARSAVVAAATRHGAAVRCVWLDTSLEDAQVNACARMLERYGRLLEPDELGAADPNAFPPGAQFRYRRELEPPAADEGFAAVETHRFERRSDPARAAAGLIVDLDDVVWRGRPARPVDVELLPGRAEALAAARARGLALAGVTWLPGLTEAEAAACVERLVDQLGFYLPVGKCLHPGGPPICWCRKPLPGLGVALAAQLGLDPTRTRHVGLAGRPLDRTFAERLGFQYLDAGDFFS
jgi:aryl-alcohol dehydrogenase-like predicted oxidoreductase